MLAKLKNKKGFTMTEILVTLVLLSLFFSMMLNALQMLYTLTSKSNAQSHQQTLATIIVKALENEMRNATNISQGLRDYTTHPSTAGFIYDSTLFDYNNLTSTTREIIFVDPSDGQLYIGNADDLSSAAKPLIGSAMYQGFEVRLSYNSSSTGVTPLDDASTGTFQNGKFQIAFTLEDSNGNSYGEDMIVYSIVNSTTTP